MDEIVLEGKQYISSKRASELTGYAKDYIGQLARQEKVLATRVGRAWYVLKSDIQKHAGIEPKEPEREHNVETHNVTSIQEQKMESATIKSLVQHQSRLPQTNVKKRSLASLRHESVTRDPFKTWNSVNYFKDETPLFPNTLQQEDSKENKVTIKATHHAPLDEPAISKEKVSPVKISLKNETKTTETQSRVHKIRPQKLTPLVKDEKPLVLAYAFVFFLLAISMGVIGGFYIPSEWAFLDQPSVQANSIELGMNYDAIISYFVSIFNEGVALIGEFLGILFDSLGLLFEVGLQFIFDLLNLG